MVTSVPMTGILTYSSNNSGGSWWLEDSDWDALEAAGWVVHWHHDADDPSHEHADASEWAGISHSHAYSDRLVAVEKPTSDAFRWLGALAKSASKATDDPDAAIAEFESLTNQSADDEGCNCCGPPHNFSFTDSEGKNHYFDSAPVSVSYQRSWS